MKDFFEFFIFYLVSFKISKLFGFENQSIFLLSAILYKVKKMEEKKNKNPTGPKA